MYNKLFIYFHNKLFIHFYNKLFINLFEVNGTKTVKNLLNIFFILPFSMEKNLRDSILTIHISHIFNTVEPQ